jgi:hypothetical protein
MLPFSALQAANHQAALAQQLAHMQAAAAAQHYNYMSDSQVNFSPSTVTSLGGQHGIMGNPMTAYTNPGGHVYGAGSALTQAQAQALSALGQHQHYVNGLLSSVPNMALSSSMSNVTLAHPASSMQKLLSLPPPKVQFCKFSNYNMSMLSFRIYYLDVFYKLGKHVKKSNYIKYLRNC